MVKLFSFLFLLKVVICKGDQAVVEQQTCQKSETNGECMMASESSSVIVIKDFLDADACRKYREVPIDSKSTRKDDNLEGEVPVEDEHANRFIQTFAEIENRNGHDDDQVMKLEDIPGYENPETSIKAKHTYLMKTSALHQDYYKEGDDAHTMVKGNVAFVFLNSNPNATFHHPGSLQPIVAEEGTLVIFKGNELHKTTINSGDLHLFGPLDTMNHFSVGLNCGDEPVPAPKCGFFDLKCKKLKLICFLFGIYCESAPE